MHEIHLFQVSQTTNLMIQLTEKSKILQLTQWGGLVHTINGPGSSKSIILLMMMIMMMMMCYVVVSMRVYGPFCA